MIFFSLFKESDGLIQTTETAIIKKIVHVPVCPHFKNHKKAEGKHENLPCINVKNKNNGHESNLLKEQSIGYSILMFDTNFMDSSV